MDEIIEGGDKLPPPEYLTIKQFIDFVQRFQENKEIQDLKISELEERVEDLIIKNRVLEDVISIDVVQKSRGSNKGRVHALYEFIQKDTNIRCINTEQVVNILGAEIKHTSEPSKLARRVMKELADNHPEITYLRGGNNSGKSQSYIKITPRSDE